MRLLVLGGSGFVGRAVVDDGLARGWEVATLNRGARAAHPDPRVRRLTGDRASDAPVDAALGTSWDVVVDTWAGAPEAVLRAARALAPHADRYAYVSSCSVYEPLVPGVAEDAATVEASPDAGATHYAADKRGGEFAVQEAFGDRGLFARPGLIVGPHEDVGRLPWWLLRIARGGDVLAPGPPELPLQWIDARDLARWLLDAATSGVSGPVNAVSRPGHLTMGELLEACVDATGAGARLRWTPPDAILGAGVEPWSQLPIWIPAGHEARGLHEVDTTRAHELGLVCRPAPETVRDTWAWVLDEDRRPPVRADREPPGLDADVERALLTSRG